ncbi:MAG: hypothetical protein HYR60_07630 [Acidobacteria bacterium]|nr:hypothetical protein [Acidobacteriota bacterium]
MQISELLEVYGPSAPQVRAGWEGESMTMARVWRFLTDWSDGDLEKEWDTFLDWPPDVFALCAAVLKRSGAYTFVLEGAAVGGVELRSLDVLYKVVAAWQCYLKTRFGSQGGNSGGPPVCVPDDISIIWRTLWKCRYVPLFQISGCPQLLTNLIEMVAAADEVSQGSGLPLRTADERLRYPVICRGWSLLEPDKYGSSLCTKRIHPSAARVLPKMHTPRSGLTLRSFTHHLAFCETDEVQPRWFMIPGARGDVTNKDHINLLVVPWPMISTPSQVYKSDAGGNPLRSGGTPRPHFTYKVEDSRRVVADEVDRLCEEAHRVLGSLDGVVMPELSLTVGDYHAVRERVLARSLMLIAGVGHEATSESRGENQLCVDVPLSRHHAVSFRQGKHHRWRLDGGQIRTYGIGAGLNPENAYWENIAIGDRRLLFLVLRPWLVTSVMICEDLARHDPVGELLRAVGPHLVVALLMDGPQLANRWPSRYAAALADDPGSSVLSISCLGMVGLSRPRPTSPSSRTVALWKDASDGYAHELDVQEGAAALALTISVKYDCELTADARSDGRTAAFPVLTGVHQIRHPTEPATPVLAKKPSVHFLAPHEAAALARLVQQDRRIDPAPALVCELTGEARAVAREIWRLKTDHPTEVEMAKWRAKPEDFAELPTVEQTETAERIFQWFKTNQT